MLINQHPDIDLVSNEHRHGFGRNHNAVLTAVWDGRLLPMPRYICILNDDTLLGPGTLSALTSQLDRDPRVGIIGPLIVDGSGVVQHTYYRYPTIGTDLRVFLRMARPRATASHAWLNGACIIARTTTLKQIGGFDEEFFLFGEDVDLCYRVNRAGYLVQQLREVSVVHYGHTSVARLEHGSRMEMQMVRSRYLFDVKHHGTRHARRVLALHRGVLRARGVCHWVRNKIGGSECSGPLARLLFEKAAYDPRQRLHHETASLGHPPPVWQP
jgi:GT2 family glycosyltransferase